jgi:hypothetical protein
LAERKAALTGRHISEMEAPMVLQINVLAVE